MNSPIDEKTDLWQQEAERVCSAYSRRKRTVSPNKDACWQEGHMFIVAERRRVAAALLHAAGIRLWDESRCMEVGYGSQGWLTDLMHWGVRAPHLSGIELDPYRAGRAQALLPCADLRIGDATCLPWEDEQFDLVVVSLVFTSILEQDVRQRIAREVTRVLKPGGALLWYDFRVNNPFNKNVRRVNRRELRALFPGLSGRIRSLTPIPPVCQIAAPWSWFLPAMVGLVPLFRTHLLAVLQKR
jgi:SAM-dependent methyltransferase